MMSKKSVQEILSVENLQKEADIYRKAGDKDMAEYYEELAEKKRANKSKSKN